MVLYFDLRKERPVTVSEHVDKEEFGACEGLSDGFGSPEADGFDVEDVVAELVLRDGGWVAAEVFMDEAHGPVVGVARASGIGDEGESLGVVGHGRPGVLVTERIGMLAWIGPTEWSGASVVSG